jgi:response regulator RpfG family c-di-GMP phosphodiesterase
LTQRQNEELKELNANLEAKVLERTAELKQVNDFLEVTNEKLKANFLTSIKVFSNLIEMRGGSLAGHSRRVADLARKIAAKMEMKPREVQDVFLAGLLHDIGKIGFSDVLLSTPVSSLSGENLGHYRKHAVRGEQALMALEELREAAKILRSHHERFDGQGFPDSLAGLAIPLGARILAVANDYDGLQMGMLSPRRATPEDAKALIAKARGKRYDPHAVEAFLAVTGNIEPEVTGEVQISPRDLQPDMVLARDLVTREGVLLLSADYILDYGLIQQIQGFNEAEEVPMTLYVRTDRRR